MVQITNKFAAIILGYKQTCAPELYSQITRGGMNIPTISTNAENNH